LIAATSSVFQSYRGGIFNSPYCGTNLDHAVNIVGWGSAGGVEYWLMRNSWNTWWGESGYMRVQITSGAGICGINQYIRFPATN
jgi:C1A family cysteine protease